MVDLISQGSAQNLSSGARGAMSQGSAQSLLSVAGELSHQGSAQNLLSVARELSQKGSVQSLVSVAKELSHQGSLHSFNSMCGEALYQPGEMTQSLSPQASCSWMPEISLRQHTPEVSQDMPRVGTIKPITKEDLENTSLLISKYCGAV